MQAPLSSPHRASYARFLAEGFERLLHLLFPRRGASVELHYYSVSYVHDKLSRRLSMVRSWRIE